MDEKIDALADEYCCRDFYKEICDGKCDYCKEELKKELIKIYEQGVKDGERK